LVHDLGHGAFSHAFEEATKALNKDLAVRKDSSDVPPLKKHEIWTSDIITKDTELSSLIVDERGLEFQESVSNLLTSETPKNIYAAVVSSQFDADRLDYLRRDRLMTGAQHGGFDFSWVLANLEVGTIGLATDDEDFSTVDSLVLGNKAFQAAESYVLGLFHMYFTVYFHKATRSAEKMLTAILRRIGALLDEGSGGATGLVETNPIVQFIMNRDLESYLKTDDFVIWGSLSVLTQCDDDILKQLSQRLLNRDLYKSVDISNHFENQGGNAAVAKFRAELTNAKQNGIFEEAEILEDQPSRDPYKRRGHGSPEALSKIHIRSTDNNGLLDLSDCSEVVKALDKKSIYRVYVRDENAKSKIYNILNRIN